MCGDACHVIAFTPRDVVSKISTFLRSNYLNYQVLVKLLK